MEQVRIQVLFTEKTAHGDFTDALYFTEEEYASKTREEIDLQKAIRVKNYVSNIDNAKLDLT